MRNERLKARLCALSAVHSHPQEACEGLGSQTRCNLVSTNGEVRLGSEEDHRPEEISGQEVDGPQDIGSKVDRGA